MLVLLDNNFVDRDGLKEYLEASPENRAAIPHAAFVEWHKGKAEKVTRRVLQQVCAFSRRIVILRDTLSILHMRGQPKKIMMRLIDQQQTSYFPTYCSTFITGPASAEVSAQFKMHHENARDQADALLGEARKLMELFALWDQQFDDSELSEMNGLLQRGGTLSEGLQIKTWTIAEQFAIRLLKSHGLLRLANYPGELVNTLAFRYGATVVAFYVRWRNQPGTYPTNDRNVLAHLMDIKIAAQGTYFDDFFTLEPKLHVVYQIAMSLVNALGGYTRCGKYAEAL
jgi:hypothetical protein